MLFAVEGSIFRFAPTARKWKSNVLAREINLAAGVLGAISHDHVGGLKAPWGSPLLCGRPRIDASLATRWRTS